MLCQALAAEPLPIYGDGKNVRDWLYVEDHCAALIQVLLHGRVGATYNVGGNNEMTNIDVVQRLCRILDEVRPDRGGSSYSRLITFVKDRPGHDRRYAIDASRITSELGWFPKESFDSGLQKTVQWYLEHPEWVTAVKSGSYREWVALNYGKREMQCEA
jgi:dTDP-glucose 4,6-dehydratase